jgi:L-asparaginase
MRQKRILLVSTGGTITMTAAAGDGVVPTLGGDDLIRSIPGLIDTVTLEAITFSRKPGASLTLDDLIAISTLLEAKLNEGFSGAIVVQGTDTIEETAFVLDLLVKSDRPVVVTGAMRSANAAGSDGPANLLASVIVATSAASAGLGTLVVLNDEVHAARHVQKTHTASPSAFASPGFTPLGRIIEGEFERCATVPRWPPLDTPASVGDAAVALVKIPLGDDGRLLAAVPGLGFRGVVIEAMGAGHLPAPLVAIAGRLAKDMPVVLATRVPSGPIFTRTYGFAGSEMDLIASGLIPGGSIGSLKACVLLRLLIAHGLDPKQVSVGYRERSAVGMGAG